MKTLLYVAASALVVAFAFWAYQVNYTTQEAVREVERLRLEIAQERSTIAILNAEWAYLNRPDRLRILAEQYFAELGLAPMSAEHFADPAEVTFPRAVEDRLAGDVLDAVLGGATQ